MDVRERVREVTVALDPIDAIYIVAALAEMEDRWNDSHAQSYGMAVGRAERCRRVRMALEAALYGTIGRA